MNSIEAPRSIVGMSHACHPEVPGALHLVELRARSGQTYLQDFRTRFLAAATLHGCIYQHDTKLCGYNILFDRVLLVLIPEQPGAISLALTNAERSIVRRFDHQVTPVLERGYHVCPFADEVSWQVLRYVDLASLPDGANPLDPHALSSAAEHAGFLKHGLLTAPPERLPNPAAWPAFLGEPEEKEFIEALELCLRTGKPFGPPQFVRTFRQACGRSVRSSCLGSPRLSDGSSQMVNPFGGRPAKAAGLLTQCGSAA